MTDRTAAAAVAGAALMLLGAGFLAQLSAAEWEIDPSRSSVEFTATLGGEEPEMRLLGRFEQVEGLIRFDPERPELSEIDARIELWSLSTGDPGIDVQVLDTGWLGADDHPEARIRAGAFVAGEAGYSTSAELELNGIAAPVDLRFEILLDGETARATGRAVVERLSHHVGLLAGPGDAAFEVPISFRIVALRRVPAPPAHR